MRRALVITVAVAILGVLGIWANGQVKTTAQPAAVSTVTPTPDTVAVGPTNDTTVAQTTAAYKDGTYNGESENNPYGTVQVAAIISGGKIINVKFLKMPSDEGNSRVVTSFAEPQLKSQTLKSQSAHVDFVSGATQTSESYQQSLQSALDQAKVS